MGGNCTVRKQAYIQIIFVARKCAVLVALLAVDHQFELGELLGWQYFFLVDLLLLLLGHVFATLHLERTVMLVLVQAGRHRVVQVRNFLL